MENFQTKVNALAARWKINGNLCVSINGEVTASGAYGLCDREHGISYARSTRTYIASVTKQFTAVCAMMLREEDKIDIDDTLNKYVPEYSHAGEVTIRQMLNMTSGIPHELGVIYDRLKARRAEFRMSDREFAILATRACAPAACTPADFLAIVNPEPLTFIPGEKFEYSDTNYMLIGEIISRVSGMPFGDFVKERIFSPLKMRSAIVGADYTDGPSYDEFDGTIENLGKPHFTTGEGSICVTADDLNLWLNAVLERKFISEESWKDCFTMVHDAYGFGWIKFGDWFTHDGGDLGYSSNVYINFKTKAAIAVALNMPSYTKDTNFFRELRLLTESELAQQLR